MSFEATEQMFPHAGKGKERLPDIEDDMLISKEVQVQAFPGCRALFDEQEALKRDFDMLIIHGDCHCLKKASS